MRTPFFIALLSAGLAANFSSARGIDSIINALAAMPDYAATVEYAVTLPQADDDVIYTVSLRQPASPDSYLIDWSVMSPSGPVEGFTAWFDGHFYTFRNRRLREHHEDWDASAPSGAKAIQNSAQFASLLPSRIAMQLREISAGEYSLNIHTHGGEVIIRAARQIADEPDAELTWTLDSATCSPREFLADYNPGTISGQQVRAVYKSAERIDTALSEEYLRRRYPDAFGRYRESQFAIENMRGEPLPSFSLPTSNGGRLSRRADDPFDFPMVVALFDPENPLADDMIAEIRGAVAQLPQAAGIIWAGTNKNPDAAIDLLGTLSPEETIVTAAGSLAMDCGAAVLPVIMVCDVNGRISDLTVGMNKTLRTDVIRMLTRVHLTPNRLTFNP